jgi:hypothetical protein
MESANYEINNFVVFHVLPLQGQIISSVPCYQKPFSSSMYFSPRGWQTKFQTDKKQVKSQLWIISSSNARFCARDEKKDWNCVLPARRNIYLQENVSFHEISVNISTWQAAIISNVHTHTLFLIHTHKLPVAQHGDLLTQFSSSWAPTGWKWIQPWRNHFRVRIEAYTTGITATFLNDKKICFEVGGSPQRHELHKNKNYYSEPLCTLNLSCRIKLVRQVLLLAREPNLASVMPSFGLYRFQLHTPCFAPSVCWKREHIRSLCTGYIPFSN